MRSGRHRTVGGGKTQWNYTSGIAGTAGRGTNLQTLGNTGKEIIISRDTKDLVLTERRRTEKIVGQGVSRPNNLNADLLHRKERGVICEREAAQEWFIGDNQGEGPGPSKGAGNPILEKGKEGSAFLGGGRIFKEGRRSPTFRCREHFWEGRPCSKEPFCSRKGSVPRGGHFEWQKGPLTTKGKRDNCPRQSLTKNPQRRKGESPCIYLRKNYFVRKKEGALLNQQKKDTAGKGHRSSFQGGTGIALCHLILWGIRRGQLKRKYLGRHPLRNPAEKATWP